MTAEARLAVLVRRVEGVAALLWLWAEDSEEGVVPRDEVRQLAAALEEGLQAAGVLEYGPEPRGRPRPRRRATARRR